MKFREISEHASRAAPAERAAAVYARCKPGLRKPGRALAQAGENTTNHQKKGGNAVRITRNSCHNTCSDEQTEKTTKQTHP